MANRFALRHLLPLSSLLLSSFLLQSASAQEPLGTQATDHFRPARTVPQTLHAPAAMLTQLGRQQRAAISLAAGDFFEDGANGLVTGYSFGTSGVLAVQKGLKNLPGPDDLTSPFVATASYLDAGLRPDLLKSEDLNGDGHQDIVVGARGQSALRVLLGDGAGNFALQPAIALGGALSALATWKDATGSRRIVAAVCAAGTCAVELHASDGTLIASVPTGTDSIAVLETARLNGNPAPDVIVGSASTLFVLDGASILSGTPKLEALPITGAVAVATGNFVYDRRLLRQIAVLTGDGSLHILARTGVEPITLYKPRYDARQILQQNQRLGIHPAPAPSPGTLTWTDFEVLPGIASFTGRQEPLLVRSRSSMSGGDDLLLFNAAGGHAIMVRHPVVNYPPDADSPFRGTIQTPPAVVTTESAATGEIAAAIPLRISQQGGHGFVFATRGAQPLLAPLGASNTYNVNTSADTTTAGCAGSTCSLRQAFLMVTAHATSNEMAGKADTINLPALTSSTSYTLSNNGTDNNDAIKIHIEIAGPVNLLGQGTAANTIITTNNADKIFSENSFDDPSESGQPPMDFYMSNITLTKGTNNNNNSANPNADNSGGLIDADTGGAGYITFVNCAFTNGTNLWGPGGGIFASNGLLDTPNYTAGAGILEIDTSTFTGNRTPEGGGGLSTFYNTDNGGLPVLLNGDTFTGNIADLTLNTSDTSATYATGLGGGFAFGTLRSFCTQSNGSCTTDNKSTDTESVIKNSTFLNNTATLNSGSNSNFTGQGGGLWADSTLTLTNNIFTGNTAAKGGGIYVNAEGYPFAWTGQVVTANTAQTTGGGIYINSPFPAAITYSTIAANVSKGSGPNGIAIVSGSGTNGTMTLTDNFWGCNLGANMTGCDKVTESNNQTLTLTPYAVLSAGLNTTTPNANGGTVIVTGAINTDNMGAALGSGNLFGFSTLPDALSITQSGANLVQGTGVLNASASASLSTNLSSSGSGYGIATVYNATVQQGYTAQVAYQNLTIAFSPTTVAVNGTSTLTFTASNPNTSVPAQNVSFSDSLPTNLIVQTPNGVVKSGSCGNTSTVTATAGSGTISFSGGNIFNGAPCTITVNVTPTAAGSYPNTTGQISSSNQTGSVPPTSNTATLVATQPVAFSEAFTAATVPVNGSTNLVFTLNNGTGTAQSAVAFSDTLPSGLQIGAIPTTTCPSGTYTGTAGGSTFSLSGATLAVGASCTFTISITGTTAGAHVNTSGTISSSPAGTGATSSATLTVLTAPTVALSFNYTQLVAGGKTVLSVVLTNPNASTALTGVAISDTLPANLTLTSDSNGCGGSNPFTSSQFALSGVTLAGGASCTLTANLTIGSTLGTTSTTTGTVSSANGGTGLTGSASASVVAAPTLTVSSPALINRGSAQTVTATYTITSGSPAPTASLSLYNGGTLVASASPTALNATTYTATIPLASLAGGTYTLTVQYPGDAYYGTGTSSAFPLTVIANNIWIGNGNATTSAFEYNGSLLLTTPDASGGTGIAIDASGNVWSIAAASNSVAKYTSTGTVTSNGYTGGGLSSPDALTIDGAGMIWIANATNSVSVFTNAGTPFSTTPYTGSLNAPTGISVDLSGNLWIINSGNNTVTEILGAAAPTLTPLATGVGTNQTATKP